MYYNRNYIYCSENERKNILEHDDVFYCIKNLQTDSEGGGKGGNSCVFELQDPNDDETYIIKFCKYWLGGSNEKIKKRIYRFENEIRALELAKKIDSDNIIELLFSGEKKIGGKIFRFYVMEKGDKDLSDFLTENEVSIQQKILLCTQILAGIKELHENIKVYHRDIKPDNIFFVGNTWKIGDLGLISSRESDYDLDDIREKIGPYGWLSPEVTNKVLCEGTVNEDNFSCMIDQSSDIFQLGKLFWYIFQGNIPVGQIRNDDFLIQDETIFIIIQLMLQYSKDRRPKMEKIETEFKKTYSSFGL